MLTRVGNRKGLPLCNCCLGLFPDVRHRGNLFPKRKSWCVRAGGLSVSSDLSREAVQHEEDPAF